MDPELDQDSNKTWVFIYQALLKTQTLIKDSLELISVFAFLHFQLSNKNARLHTNNDQ